MSRVDYRTITSFAISRQGDRARAETMDGRVRERWSRRWRWRRREGRSKVVGRTSTGERKGEAEARSMRPRLRLSPPTLRPAPRRENQPRSKSAGPREHQSSRSLTCDRAFDPRKMGANREGGVGHTSLRYPTAMTAEGVGLRMRTPFMDDCTGFYCYSKFQPVYVRNVQPVDPGRPAGCEVQFCTL